MVILNNMVRGAMVILTLVSCKTTSPGGSGLKDDPPASVPPANVPPANVPPADVPPAIQIKSPFGENDFEEIKGQYTGVMERNGKPCGVTILNRIEDWRILRELDISFTEWRLLVPGSPPGSAVKTTLYFSEPKIGPNSCKVEKQSCGEVLSVHKDNLITLADPVNADGGDYEIKVVDLTLKDKIPVSFIYDEQAPVVFGRACDRLITRRGHGDYMMKCQNLKKVGN